MVEELSAVVSVFTKALVARKLVVDDVTTVRSVWTTMVEDLETEIKSTLLGTALRDNKRSSYIGHKSGSLSLSARWAAASSIRVGGQE